MALHAKSNPKLLPMSEAPLVVEEAGYHCECFAAQELPGRWHGIVTFERSADAVKELIPMTKHRLLNHFSDQQAALQAAKAFALARARSGDTGL